MCAWFGPFVGCVYVRWRRSGRASERVRMSFLFEFVFIGEHSSYSYINIYISRYIPAYSIYTIQLL